MKSIQIRKISGVAVALSIFIANQLSADDWPQWRGPDRDGVSKETGLLKTWTADQPKQLWIYRNAGNGYSGPAIAQGKLFTMGTRNGSEILLALEADTGRELWATPLGGILDNSWGDGPRGTPAVDGERVYALSGLGHLVCATVNDGTIVWQKTMQELGGSVPNWGFAESVLVDGDKVICTPGGSKGAIAALNKRTGSLIWQSKEFTEPAHYSSVVPSELNGTRQYVQLTENFIVGIDSKDGKLLWQSEFPGRTAVIPTPVVWDGFVYVTAGYGAGCKLLKIGPNNHVTVVYQNRVIKNHHGGVLLIGDHLYGHADPGWTCQEFKTGKEVWNERRKLGKGAIGSADGMLYCLDERTGTVALIEASPAGWREQGRFKLEPLSKIRSSSGGIWTHPVISNGKLYLRDQDLIYCYSVR